MHPNAEAHLWAKISLVPDSLLNSNASLGDASLFDPHVPSSMPTNLITSSGDLEFCSGPGHGENLVQNTANSGEISCDNAGGGRDFMCLP